MKYKKPEFEVIELKIFDVIRTSDPNATVIPVPGSDNNEGNIEGDF